MEKYICLHGHFYQPPRENPWLEDVEMQDSAQPFHDWNERITAECYAPNAAARILGANNFIAAIVNNYPNISFNFGPTLLTWLERHNPEIYSMILESDRLSQTRYAGHGSALAQVYNHMIMPLANARDKQTQVVWGIHDFEHRFRRRPEGMWLAETAVDMATLECLAEHGVRFTILAAHQAAKIRWIGSEKWQDVSGGKIDPRRPYRCPLPSGRYLEIFFYDNPIAHDVAFGGLLNNGENFAKRLLDAFSGPDQAQPDAAQLVHVAVDGETYGHHHRYGEMALAYAQAFIESRGLARFTVYGEYLDKFPPQQEVEIFPNTSWSCFHGIERWRKHCGCTTGRVPNGSQAWREPLREAMDDLRDQLAPIYEQAAGDVLKDPWQARDEYIPVILDRDAETRRRFFAKHARQELDAAGQVRMLKCLEMQRHAMLMYTSCGWFFDDISGIETLQVMQYAARAIQLAREVSGRDLEERYLGFLQKASSNYPEFFNGEQVWKEYIEPSVIDLGKIAAHYAASTLFEKYAATATLYCFGIQQLRYQATTRDKAKLVTGGVRIISEITGEERRADFAIVQREDDNLLGGLRLDPDPGRAGEGEAELHAAAARPDYDAVERLLEQRYDVQSYSLWLLYKDEQMKALDYILDPALQEMEENYRRFFEKHYPLIQVMNKMRIPLPNTLSTTVEFVLNTDMNRLLAEDVFDLNRLWTLANEIKKWPFKRDRSTLTYNAGRKLSKLMERLAADPLRLALLEYVEESLDILLSLSLDLDMWKAQNIYCDLDKKHYPEMRAQAENSDANAKKWVETFTRLGRHLRVERK